MGIDIIGWRECPLQAALGPDVFLAKLKLTRYKALADELPAEKREKLVLRLPGPGGEPRKISYGELRAEAESFAAGIPECDVCPISSGAKLGCYRYVSYPVEETLETLLFQFFVEQAVIPGSASNQIYTDVVATLPETTEWHESRGDASSLAALAEPLSATLGPPVNARIDSAQVLAAAFRPLEDAPHIVAYSLFWIEFFQFLRKRGIEPGQSQSLMEAERLKELLGLAALNSVIEKTGIKVDA